MPIAKIQNVSNQQICAADATGRALQQGVQITIPGTSTPLASLLNISPNAENVLVSFFGTVWVRFDGGVAKEYQGHKFTSNDNPTFNAELIKTINVCAADSDGAMAFVSQFGGVC